MSSRRPTLVALFVAAALVGCSTGGPDVETLGARQQRSSPTVTDPPDQTPTTVPSSPPTSATTGEGSTPPSEPDPPAETGIGDELFPDLGNPGLDVTHYDVDVAYAPDDARIDGTVVLSIAATDDLGTFSLDAIGLDVTDVEVDGEPVEFATADPELLITPTATIADGTMFEVTVRYSTHASKQLLQAGLTAGWFDTDTGSFVINEPDGARTWLPSNDHPSDKATYHFTIRVQPGLTGVANGSLVSESTEDGLDVWEWDQPEPMTTYLIQLLTGPYEIINGTGPNGLPMISAILSRDTDVMQPFIDVTSDQIDFFDDYFGPFPLASYGLAMTDGYIGGAIEDQGRSLFSRQDFELGRLEYPQDLLLSHELAHQWFGDSVSPAEWQDIWLNESFATYGQWMWMEYAGYELVEQSARRNLADRQGGSVATGAPGVSDMFSYEVYDGGAVVLHALRLTIGDDAFFTTLQRWSHDYSGTSKSTDDFIALAAEVSGQDLTQFFDDWLYATDLPDEYPS